MPISFDIETIPNADMLDKLPEPEVKIGNLKDELKIKAKIDGAKAKQISKMALSPFYGRVCCFSFCDEGGATGSINMEEMTDEVERSLLSAAFTTLAKHLHFEEVSYITWNGAAFDFPFLFTRAVMLGVSPLLLGDLRLPMVSRRMSSRPHCDLAAVLAGGSRDISSLDETAKAVLGEEKLKVDFSEFPAMIRGGEAHKIAEYCEHDAALTMRVYDRYAPFLF